MPGIQKKICNAHRRHRINIHIPVAWLQKKESGKKGVITYSFKEKKPPIIFARVQNRGWFKNKKNNKIHFFDNKGFTHSLKYLKNDTEFNNFTRNLEPFDIQQLTPELFYSKVSKKIKDWITEYAALGFVSINKRADAVCRSKWLCCYSNTTVQHSRKRIARLPVELFIPYSAFNVPVGSYTNNVYNPVTTYLYAIPTLFIDNFGYAKGEQINFYVSK